MSDLKNVSLCNEVHCMHNDITWLVFTNDYCTVTLSIKYKLRRKKTNRGSLTFT